MGHFLNHPPQPPFVPSSCPHLPCCSPSRPATLLCASTCALFPFPVDSSLQPATLHQPPCLLSSQPFLDSAASARGPGSHHLRCWKFKALKSARGVTGAPGWGPEAGQVRAGPQQPRNARILFPWGCPRSGDRQVGTKRSQRFARRVEPPPWGTPRIFSSPNLA